MRCPKCHTETPPGASVCPGCRLATPKGKNDIAQAKEKEFDRRSNKFSLGRLISKWSGSDPDDGDADSSRAKVVVRVAALVIIIGAIAFGAFYAISTYWQSKEVDMTEAMTAMSSFKALPSNEEGLTVNDKMAQEVKKLKDASNLKGSQGWHLEKIVGSESKVLVVYSFQDKTEKEYRAEWLADVPHNVFIPQTPLAREVFSK